MKKLSGLAVWHLAARGIFWGHPLGQYTGLWGMYMGIMVSLLGIALVLVGWRQIHKEYWSQ